MKKIIYQPLLSVLMLGLTTTLTAQVRETLDDLTSNQRDELAGLIRQYVNEEIIGTHAAAMPFSGGLPPIEEVHMNENFFPFHRAYLAGLEDFLILQGHPEYVPLPKWEPEQAIPQDFEIVDQDCNGAWPGNPCASLTNTNANPNRAIPPQFAGSNLCNLNEAQVLGQGLNQASMIEMPWHNNVHVNIGGTMNSGKSPAATIFWPWHAYVDDVWKEWECDCESAPDLDLWMRDKPMKLGNTLAQMGPMEMDIGHEPNPETGPIYRTTDIWIRNQPNGFITDVHESPIYDGTNPVYVYVRIRNRGCLASSGTETVDLHWSKAGTDQDWPQHWNSQPNQNPPLGGFVGTETIPIIDAGGSTIVQFTWQPLDPDLYENEGLDSDISNFCFIAKIDGGPNDPDPALTMGPDMRTNVKNHNNLVWKNIQVIDAGLKPAPCWAIYVGNGSEEPATIDLQFATLNVPRNGEIWEEAEVVVQLDQQTWNRWVAGGQRAENIKIFRKGERRLLITGNNAYLRNLTYAPRQRSMLCLRYSFLIEEVTGREEFQYQVIQHSSDNQRMMGGQAHVIRRDAQRANFLATVQSTINSQTENTQLSANSIGEPAIYNWYKNDSLVYTGTSMSVSPAIDQQYKLEVIADADGHKDYGTVSVEGTGYDIESMTPNPASSSVVVTYDVEQANSATLQITSISGAPLGSYSLNLNTDQKTINVSNYSNGLYIVVLRVDGKNTDSENLVIQ